MLARQVEQPAYSAGGAGAAPQVQGVEYADLDVGMGSEGAHHGVEAVAGGVVEQHAHAHAAVGGAQQLVDQGSSAQAIMDDVVLQVDARLGVADQLGAGAKGLVAVGQQAKARAPVIGRGLALDGAAERRFAGRQRLADLAGRTDAGAARQAKQQRQQQWQSSLESQVKNVLYSKGFMVWTVEGGAKLRRVFVRFQ